jgi:hypothetical protein
VELSIVRARLRKANERVAELKPLTRIEVEELVGDRGELFHAKGHSVSTKRLDAGFEARLQKVLNARKPTL